MSLIVRRAGEPDLQFVSRLAMKLIRQHQSYDSLRFVSFDDHESRLFVLFREERRNFDAARHLTKRVCPQTFREERFSFDDAGNDARFIQSGKMSAVLKSCKSTGETSMSSIPKSTVIRPPFTLETARAKVKAAENAWNTRDPDRVALAYTEDSAWRNRDEFFTGREAIKEFLRRKWAKEIDYRLMKELWAFTGNRISVRFEYEWRDTAGNWYRSHGNEHWEFDAEGLMSRRDASINDVPIAETERRVFEVQNV